VKRCTRNGRRWIPTKEGAAIRALAVQPSSTHGAHRSCTDMERVQSSMRVRDTPVRVRCHQGASATSARLIQYISSGVARRTERGRAVYESTYRILR
jgi:hypothetical protein